MLRLGLRKGGPAIKVVGCQHAPFPPLYLNYFPSTRAIEENLIPDHIVSIGKEHHRIFTRSNYPGSCLKAGSAFRYNYLFALETSTPSDTRDVLIATSISYEESLELVYKCLAFFHTRSEYRVMIKFHPKLNRQHHLVDRVLRMLGCSQLPEHVQIVSESMDTLLARTGIVFYNFTAVCYEALARHIPVVFVRSDICFDMNKLEWFDEVNYEVSSSDDMDRVIQEVMNINPERRMAWEQAANEVIAESFTEPKKEELASIYQ